MPIARRILGVLALALACEGAFVGGTLPVALAPLLLILLVAMWAVGSRLQPAWLSSLVGLGAALVVYAGTAGAAPSPARLLGATALLAALVALDPARRALAIAFGGTAVSLASVGVVFARVAPQHAEQLAISSTALAVAAALVLGHRAWSPELRVNAAAAPGDSGPPPARWLEAQGLAFAVAAASLPIGEGIATIAIGVLAAVLVARRVVQGPTVHARSTGARWVAAATLVYIAAGAAAVGVGGEGWLRPREVGRLAPLLAAPVAYLSVRALPRSWHRRALAAFIVSLSLSALTAVALYVVNPAPDSIWLAPLRWFSAGAQAHVPGDAGRLVAGGFYFHRLKLAHVLVLGAAPLCARQLFAPLDGRRRAIEGGIVVLFGVALLLTFSRAALLGVIAGAAACALVSSKRMLIAGVVTAAALLTLALPAARERVLSIGSAGAAAERAPLWGHATEMLAEHPFGAGLGNYPTLVRRYYDPAPTTHLPPYHYAHNLVLSAWAEAGPLGLAGFVGVWAGLATLCLAAFRRGVDLPAAATGLFIGAAGWTIGLTHDFLFHTSVALVFAVAVGAVLARIATGPGGLPDPA